MEEQIRTIVLRAFVKPPLSVEKVMLALTENIPGVSFDEIVVHRNGAKEIVGLDVTFLDEIHNPAHQTVSVVTPPPPAGSQAAKAAKPSLVRLGRKVAKANDNGP